MTTDNQSQNLPSRNLFATKPFRILLTLVVLLFGGIFVFKLLKDNTTVSFTFLLDGKPLTGGAAPKVQIDGKAFTSGLSITPGPHKLTVELPNAEPFARRVWVFFGAKNLGALPLESIKGSLLVSVNPSPATVIVRRGVEILGNGNAPLTVENLPIGDYELEIKRNEYKEIQVVKILGKPRTTAKIELNLGGVDLSATPTNPDFKLSGNGRQWEGKLPTNLVDVAAGNYTLVVRRGKYEEAHQIEILKQQRIQTNILLNLGGVDLSSVPGDADYELLNATHRSRGTLPTKIDYLPAGEYSLTVTRKGWQISTPLRVTRSNIATNLTIFPYGSINITSNPNGLPVSSNGVVIGKTPMRFAELQPATYSISTTDGESELSAEIPLATNQVVSRAFNFIYGSVKLTSAPPGATVFRKGKDIGTTPITIPRIPDGEASLNLVLEGYVSTNLTLSIKANSLSELHVKLISTRFLEAIHQSQLALNGRDYERAIKEVESALAVDNVAIAALELKKKIQYRASLSSVEKLLGDESFVKALTSLQAVEKQHGKTPEISGLEETIRAQRLRKVNEYIAESDNAIASKGFTNATSKLSMARALLPDYPNLIKAQAQLDSMIQRDKEDRFKSAVELADSALVNKRYADFIEGLREAVNIFPQHNKVKELQVKQSELFDLSTAKGVLLRATIASYGRFNWEQVTRVSQDWNIQQFGTKEELFRRGTENRVLNRPSTYRSSTALQDARSAADSKPTLAGAGAKAATTGAKLVGALAIGGLKIAGGVLGVDVPDPLDGSYNRSFSVSYNEVINGASGNKVIGKTSTPLTPDRIEELLTVGRPFVSSLLQYANECSVDSTTTTNHIILKRTFGTRSRIYAFDSSSGFLVYEETIETKNGVVKPISKWEHLEYKTFDGITIPTKIIISISGKKQWENTLSDCKYTFSGQP